MITGQFHKRIWFTDNKYISYCEVTYFVTNRECVSINFNAKSNFIFQLKRTILNEKIPSVGLKHLLREAGDSFSVLNTQQCFLIFFCSVDTENNVQSFTEKLLRKVSKNSLQPILSRWMLLRVFVFHLVKSMPSCRLFHHFSNFL